MTAAANGMPAAGDRPNFRPLVRSLAIDIAVPLAIVELLLHQAVPVAAAFAAGGVPPLVRTIDGIVRRRIDALAIIALAGLAVSLVLTVITGNAVFAVAKESLFTAALGLVYFGSLAAPRPLTFVLGRQLTAGDDPVKAARWNARWSEPRFRRGMRVSTIVWGAGFLADAAARIAVAVTLPPAAATAAAAAIAVLVFGGLIAWTRRYSRAGEARHA